MPITENSKQNEWETTIAIAKNNEFSISILTDENKDNKEKKAKTKTSPNTTTTRENNTAM
jgi:hypothetical protein